MWASQRSHYYIVNLLVTSGADLTLVDGQGYNILHLGNYSMATLSCLFSSSIRIYRSMFPTLRVTLVLCGQATKAGQPVSICS